MKSYKNKRVRSRRNKSRRYSRKRKGGEIEIDATKEYKMFKFPGCKDLKNKVLKIKQDYPNEKFTFSSKAQEQITKCNRNIQGAITYRDEIENMIKNNQQLDDTPITEENIPSNVSQNPSQEEIEKAKQQLDEEAEIRAKELAEKAALDKMNKDRDFLGLKRLDKLPIFSEDTTPLGEIPVGERKPELMGGPYKGDGPYNGGKKRRHRKKSRKHSRRH